LSEYFYVNLSKSSNAYVADQWGWGTIVDDEPIVNIGGHEGVEGNTGTTTFTFTLTLATAYDVPVTVDFATEDDYWANLPATAGVDYTAASGTLTFAPGQTSKPITVQVVGDRIREGDETFLVSLSNANYGCIDNGQAEGYIVDDEPTVWLGGS